MDRLTAEERAAIEAYAGPVQECQPGLPREPEWQACFMLERWSPKAPPAKGMVDPAFDEIADA